MTPVVALPLTQLRLRRMDLFTFMYHVFLWFPDLFAVMSIHCINVLLGIYWILGT
jgi:hypothetical protein